MEAATALRSSPLLPKSPAFASPSRAPSACRPDSLAFGSAPRLSIKGWRSISLHKQGRRRTQFVIRASLSSSSSFPIAPLRLESPIGEFLSEILTRHPHLLSAAVDRQLQLLDTDRQSDDSKEELKPNPTGTDLVLYKRIAEVKANERRRVLEEILYALVVEKFVKANVSLVPPISRPAGSSGRVDQWPPQEEELERAHSPEAFEMIMNHLALILGQRLGDSKSVAPISKLRVGQVYAASVMYGYFLKRVDQRLQLEKSMRTLPWGSDGEDEGNSRLSSQARKLQSEVSSRSSPGFRQGGFVHGGKPCRLRTYVMSFDTEMQQRLATIRSKEAFSIIEKHTEALFGRPEIVITPKGTIDSSKDEIIKISFAGLRRLILEAVTFGSFLWDVESYVDSRYHFVTS